MHKYVLGQVRADPSELNRLKFSIPHRKPTLPQSIESLLRTIPECWHEFDHDDLTATEQQALFLLVAAGLVERRFGLQLEMAGRGEVVEAKLAATGEYGLVEAFDPVLAEIWTKWGDSFVQWKSGEASSSTPFRITRSGSDEWRLTEFGVMARGDLDFEAPSGEAAATINCRQRVMEYVLRTGHQKNRPPVRGEGRLVEMKIEGAGAATPGSPIPVTVTNTGELVAEFRKAIIPELIAALSGPKVKNDRPVGAGMSVAEAIALAEQHVKDHHGSFPGRNKLAKYIGCSPDTMSKAIKRSPYLNARKAEHEANKKGSNRERQVTGSLDDFAAADPSADEQANRDAELDRLMKEQRAEQMRDGKFRKKVRRRSDDD